LFFAYKRTEEKSINSSKESKKMNINKLVIEFGTVFAVTLVTVALVTFLWNFIGHRDSIVDWETSLSSSASSFHG
jgi:hypothetical protein